MSRKKDKTRNEPPPSRWLATATRLRRIKRRWRMLRLGVRVVVVMLLLLAGAVLFALFYPLSIPWLDERIKARWADTVGLKLEYNRSTIRLARAELSFEEPVLIDPETGEHLVDLRRVELSGSLLQMIFGRGPRVIESLRLEGPAVVRVATRDERLQLLPPWPRVIDIVRKRLESKTSAGPPKAVLKQLTLAPVDLRWIEQGDAGSHVRLSLEGMALTVDFERRSRPRRLMLAGRLAEGPGPGRPFMLTVRPDESAGAADLQLRLDSFNSGEFRFSRMPVDFNTGQILASARLERNGRGEWISKGGGQLDGVRVRDRDGQSVMVGLVQTRWVARLDPVARQVAIEQLDVNGPNSVARLVGWAGTRRPWPYGLRVKEFSAGGDELKLIANRLLPAGQLASSPASSVKLVGSFFGDSATTIPARAEMSARASGLEFLLPHMPEPLHGVSGRIELTSTTLAVNQLTGRYDRTQVLMEGLAVGNLPREFQEVGLAWRTVGDGDVDGSGTLRFETPHGVRLTTALKRAQIDGGIRFRDAVIRDPRLPDRISRLYGRIRLRGNEARIEGLDAQLGGTRLFADGSLVGTESVWTSPTLTLSARVGGDLQTVRGQIVEAAKTAGVDLGGLPPALGSGEAAAQVRDFPLALWRTRPIQATIKLRDFATTVTGGSLPSPLHVAGDVDGRGTVRLSASQGLPVELDGQATIHKGRARGAGIPPVGKVGGKIGWSNGTVRFEKFTAELLGGRVTVSGTVGGRPRPWVKPHGRLAVEVSTPLGNALAQAERRGIGPRRFGFTEFGGDATVKVNLDGPLADWRGLACTGRLDVDDFYTSFSVARVGGPLRIRHLGVELGEDRLSIEPLTGSFGNVALNAEGALKPGGGLLNLRLSGDLAEMKRRSPPGLEKFDVGGSATIEHHQKIEPRPGFTPPRDWAGAIAYFGRLRDQKQGLAQLRQDWRWDFDGSIRMSKGEMTFWRMPTPLRGITGMVYYTDGRLWSAEPLEVSPGVHSRNVRSTLEITWTHDRPPRGSLAFGLTGEHFSLDEWIGPWRQRWGTPKPPPPDIPYDATLKPDFTIRGTFRTASGQYKGVQCRDADGILSLDDFHGKPAMLRWYLSQASVYDGKADISGSVYSRRMNVKFETRKVELRPLVEALTKKQSPGGLLSGNVTGRIEVAKDFRTDAPVTGKGQIHIEQSRLVSNAILRGLGGLLRLPLLEDISFSSIHGPFTIADKRVASPNLVFDNPIINLKVSGSVGFDKTLDMKIAAQVLQIASSVPLVGTAVDVLNELVGRVIRVQVRGTTENPKITPL